MYQEAAGDADFRVKILIEWQEVTTTPGSQGEYLMSIGPVTGNLNANFVYATIFNPIASNKKYIVKRIEIRANRIGTLTAPGYIPVTIRRIVSAEGGIQIPQNVVPKKHSDTEDTTAEIRIDNPIVIFEGISD